MGDCPSLLPYALQAVAQGFHIFPVEPNAKTPIRIYQDRDPEEAPWTIRWSEVATNDVNKVAEWWSYAPRANIGVACKPSGLFVVDCDTAKRDDQLKGTSWEFLHDLLGPRVDGECLYDYVAQQAGPAALRGAFDTYQVATGSGGRHFYYRWPPDVQSTQDSIVKGLLDVRGNGGERGGYVLGAGSETSAGRYVQDPDPGAPVREVPGWLLSHCRYKEPYRAPRTELPFKQPRSIAFGGLVESVRTALEGNRNNALLWAARAMCADGASEDECCDLLVPAALANGLDGGERQARQTIASAYRLQTRKTG